jgi:hypothetical protein
MKTVPLGGPCRNFRAKPEPPDLADGAVKRIPVGSGLYAYVDAADYELVSRYKWNVYGAGYAGTHVKGKFILMHRMIMKPPKGKVVDHIDGNPLNNCRSNLRVCTPPENVRNCAKRRNAASRYKCVGYDKKRGKWFSRFRFKRKHIWLGFFDEEVEAARAYDLKAVQFFGEFARPNLPEEWPPERRQEVYAQWQKENGKRNGRAKKAKAGRTPRCAKAPARKARKHPARNADGTPTGSGSEGRCGQRRHPGPTRNVISRKERTKKRERALHGPIA